MHLLKGLTLLSLSGVGYTYVLSTFSGPNCTGHAERLNVWDDTCAWGKGAWSKDGAASMMPHVFGKKHQRALFFQSSTCNFWEDYSDMWADGNSKGFQPGECFNMTFPVRAFGSIAA